MTFICLSFPGNRRGATEELAGVILRTRLVKNGAVGRISFWKCEGKTQTAKQFEDHPEYQVNVQYLGKAGAAQKIWMRQRLRQDFGATWIS